MKRVLGVAAAILAGASMLSIGTAQAALVYEFNTEFSGGSDPAGSTPWLTATFETTDTDEVTLTLNSDGLSGSEFVSGWYFNLDPFTDVSFSLDSGVPYTSATDSENAFKADGDGFFDILIEYATSGLDRFTAGLESVIILTGSGLTEDDFDALSLGAGNSPDGLFAAAHVQGIGAGGEDSGWITPGPGVTPIPIMGALPLLLSALGLLGFAGGWWRRWQSA